jgi:hypothetical protein
LTKRKCRSENKSESFTEKKIWKNPVLDFVISYVGVEKSKYENEKIVAVTVTPGREKFISRVANICWF